MTHLLIIKGDQRGRDIEVPREGLRVGRSHANDIVVADEAASQFHCRFFFKSDETLWVTDFASTNETLVNGQAVTEARLQTGDEVEVGNECFRVICGTRTPDTGQPPPLPSAIDDLADEPTAPEPESSPQEAPAPAPPPVAEPKETPASPDASEAARDFDLGFGRHHAAPFRPKTDTGIRWSRIGGLLLGIAVIALLGGIAFQMVLGEREPPAPPTPTTPPLRVIYEKVEAGPENIFRYALRIEDDEIHVQINDLNNHRHVSREKELDRRVVDQLTETLRASAFEGLQPEYAGVSPGVYNMQDLTIIIGRRAHRVRVLNRVEPDEFRRVREWIEELGRTELGLAALAMSPERLRAMAQDAYLEGRKRLEEREVRYGNLAEAIRQFRLVEWYLDTIEPKPDFYATALQEQDRAERLLEDRYQDHWFRAERAVTLSDWEEAARHLRVIMELIPDRSDERHERAETRLLTVERHLRR